MSVKSHKDLIIWQRAIELIAKVYELTAPFPKSELYGLTGQVRRAAVSIAANIAEGHARDTTRDYLRFLSLLAGRWPKPKRSSPLRSDLAF